MTRKNPHSQETDGGTAYRRPVKRAGAFLGVSPGRMAVTAVPRKPIVKTYRGRLPVSGKKPA